MPDARRSLGVLREEWEDCTKCDLGRRRNNVGGQFVFGEGKKNAILFLGEGPGRVEEEQGRPFIGKSGTMVLRRILTSLEITDHYITNCVSCRSCRPRTDAAGNVLMTKSYRGKPPRPKYEDQPPSKAQIAECLPRLHEEIYLVDPVIIVCLGNRAVETLRGSSCTMRNDHGQVEEIKIPGAGWRPSLTAKKKAWARKVKGEIVMPVEQNEVRYLMIPSWHPAHIYRKHKDFGHDNPFAQLVEDIKIAVNIYDRYMLEACGASPSEMSAEIPYEILDEIAAEQEQWNG